MPRFYNPYHFVPLADEPSKAISTTDFQDRRLGHRGHEKYSSEDENGEPVFSGRIVCKLTNKTPMVIGNKQIPKDDEPTEIENFELRKGTPAIPASSLRGMVGSVMESASNSAMRVLEADRPLSYRQEMYHAADLALGMIVIENGEKRIRPLCLPPIVKKDGKFIVTKEMKKIFPKPNLPVYIDGYNRSRLTGFLASQNPNSYSADNKSKDNFWYLSTPENLKYVDNNGIIEVVGTNGFLRIKKDNKSKTETLIGQLTNSTEIPHNSISGSRVRGILRVLGVEKRANITSTGTKKHEFFIPYTKIMEDSSPTFSISKHAWDTFHALAKERTDLTYKKNATPPQDTNELLPYSLKGSKRNSSAHRDPYIQLRDGDIVYFNVKRTDVEKKEVHEISISAIWRGSKGPVSDYIENELQPLWSERKSISIAETMLGFIEENQQANTKREESQQTKTERANMAFASRIRFSNGVLSSPISGFYETEGTMKILASPKPPSPSMYFKNKDGPSKYIAKKSLKKAHHTIQGRKFYLHHKNAMQDGWRGWETFDNEAFKNQKNKVKPIKKDCEFIFHIDFTNLNREELGLLFYSLEVDNTFHHKLGMGKSLGLGTVKVSPLAIAYVNRTQRYSKSLFEPRYSHIEKIERDAIPESFKIYDDIRDSGAHQDNFGVSFKDLRNSYQSTTIAMFPEIHNALSVIGNPDKLNPNILVHNPLITEAHPDTSNNLSAREEKSYEWFVNNDNEDPSRRQQLKPIENNEIESLETNDRY